MQVSPAIAYARARHKKFLAELMEFIRFPTISAEPKHAADIKNCAKWLANHLRRIGLDDARIIETPRHPLVFASSRRATAVRQWGFRGIKVHGLEAMPTREVCETALAFSLPLLVDVAGKTSVIEMLAPQYRQVNFIVPHLGSFADDWRAHQQVVDQLVHNPNLYADTSGVRRFDYIVQAVRRAGAHKILFGSDGPWLHPGVEIAKIRLLGLPPSEEALILGGNAVRLLREVGHKRNAADRRGAVPSTSQMRARSFA